MNNTTKELLSQQEEANIKLITENVSNSIHKLFLIIKNFDNYYKKHGSKSKILNVSELTSILLKSSKEMDSQLASIIKISNITYSGFNLGTVIDGLLKAPSLVTLFSFFGIQPVNTDNARDLSKFLLEFLIAFVKSPEKLTYEQIYRMSLITQVSIGEVIEIVNLWSKQDTVWEKSNEKYRI